MSQAELGRLCGIPQSTIGRIESGQVNPNLATLEKLAEALSLEFAIKESDVRPDYLKRWDGLHAICYWKDEPVSEFYVSGSVVRVKRFVQHPVKQIFNQEKMDIVALSEILKRRCWEENRDGLAQILQKLGIAHSVTWPRTVGSIKGCDINGIPLKGNYGVEFELYEADDEISVISKTNGKPIRKTVY